MYVFSGFLEKNRDALSMDLMNLIQKSSNKLLQQIFVSEQPNKLNQIIMTPGNSLRVRVWDVLTYHAQQWQCFSRELFIFFTQMANDLRRQISTLTGQFRQSLDSLMKTLSLCQPFFIRCFKPNDNKLSMVWTHHPIIFYSYNYSFVVNSRLSSLSGVW